MQRDCSRNLPRHVLSTLIAVTVSAVGCSGCGGAGKQKQGNVIPQSPWAGVTLTVACPDGPPRLLIDRHGAAWARQAGVTLKVVPPPGDSAPAADVWVLPASDLPHWAAADRLAVIPERDWSNVLPPYRIRLLRWENAAYALPLLGDALLCVYRADVYADAENQKAYQEKLGRALAAPATWEDLAEQAAFFASHRGKPSLPALPADETGLDRLFHAAAAAYAVRGLTEEEFRHARADPERAAAILSFQYDAVTGRPRLADPGFVDALKVLQRLQPHRSNRPSRAEAFTADEAVVGAVTLGELGALRGPGSESKWGVARVPGHRVSPGGPVNFVPYIGAGAWVGAVAKASTHGEPALELLGALSGNAVSLEVVHDPSYGGGPFRRAHLEERKNGWFNYGLSEQQNPRLLEVLAEYADPKIVNPAYALRIPAAPGHRKVLISAVRQAILSGADAAAALALVANRWQERDGEGAKADYRRSLGLQPSEK